MYVISGRFSRWLASQAPRLGFSPHVFLSKFLWRLVSRPLPMDFHTEVLPSTVSWPSRCCLPLSITKSYLFPFRFPNSKVTIIWLILWSDVVGLLYDSEWISVFLLVILFYAIFISFSAILRRGTHDIVITGLSII